MADSLGWPILLCGGRSRTPGSCMASVGGRVYSVPEVTVGCIKFRRASQRPRPTTSVMQYDLGFYDPETGRVTSALGAKVSLLPSGRRRQALESAFAQLLAENLE